MVLCDTGCLHYQGPWTLCPLNLCTEQPSLQPFASGVQPCPMSSPSVQFSSVAQSCPTLCIPMDYSTPGFPVHHQLQELAQTHVHQVGDAIQPSHLCCPLLLLPSIPPSIRVFSNESALRMRWPKYWTFSFSIIPSKEIPGS